LHLGHSPGSAAAWGAALFTQRKTSPTSRKVIIKKTRLFEALVTIAATPFGMTAFDNSKAMRSSGRAVFVIP
jgi:hypothetical protein